MLKINPLKVYYQNGKFYVVVSNIFIAILIKVFFICRYQLDSDAQPPCYRLQPISSHISGFKETSPAEREKAFEEWRAEIDKMLAVLVAVFSQELRDTYLTTVVEQVIFPILLFSITF